MQELSNQQQDRERQSLKLYQACIQSENQQLREWGYSELFPMVQRAAYNRYGYDMSLAEEIAQDTLLFVYRKIADCKKPSSFISFVMWQMRDAAKRILRRHKDSTGMNLQSWDTLTEENENLPLQGEDSSSNGPEAQYAEQELWSALNQALARLTDERLRKVVYWRYIEQLPDKEIAERLEITSGYVRRLRNTAMNKLKDDKKLRSFFNDSSL